MLKECKNCYLGLVHGTTVCTVCGGKGMVEEEEFKTEIKEVIHTTATVNEEEAKKWVGSLGSVSTWHKNNEYKKPKPWYKFW